MRKTCILGGAAALMASLSAHADIMWSSYAGGDVGYEMASNNGAWESGTVEGRIGNRLAIGTWELALWRVHDVGPFLAQGQLAWAYGFPAPFTISYDGATSVTYTVGGVTIATTQMGGPFTDIFIRTRSATFGSVELANMSVEGVAIGDLSSFGNGTVNYLRVTNGGSAFGAFTIRGTERLTWLASDPPINSQVSAQFRFTNTPAPATLIALAPLATRRRRAKA